MAIIAIDIGKTRLRLGSLVAATTIMIALIFGLINLRTTYFSLSSPVQDFAVEAQISRKQIEIKPEVLKFLREVQSNKKMQIEKSIADKPSELKSKPITNSPISNPEFKTPSANEKETNLGPAPAPVVSNANSNSQSDGMNKNLPSFSKNAEKTLTSIDCMNIIQEKRPKECPPDNKAKQMVKAVQTPKYNPQMVTGFTNAEMATKKFAGWREPCENETGGKYQFCIPMGKKPPRVKTPIELCKEKGLENCKYPNLPDGTAPNSILTKQ